MPATPCSAAARKVESEHIPGHGQWVLGRAFRGGRDCRAHQYDHGAAKVTPKITVLLLGLLAVGCSGPTWPKTPEACARQCVDHGWDLISFKDGHCGCRTIEGIFIQEVVNVANEKPSVLTPPQVKCLMAADSAEVRR